MKRETTHARYVDVLGMDFLPPTIDVARGGSCSGASRLQH